MALRQCQTKNGHALEYIEADAFVRGLDCVANNYAGGKIDDNSLKMFARPGGR